MKKEGKVEEPNEEDGDSGDSVILVGEGEEVVGTVLLLLLFLETLLGEGDLLIIYIKEKY